MSIYVNKNSSISVISKVLFSQLPKNTTCTWQSPSITPRGDELPPDFPGSSDTFYKISDKEEYEWSTQCLDKDTVPVDYYTETIYPSFICPQGSSYYCPENTFCECFESKDIACISDVVGRDLNTKIPILKEEGHVGLTGPAACSSDQTSCLKGTDNSPVSSMVIEVLNKTSPMYRSVVHVDSLSSFINSVPGFFWGEHYGPQGIVISSEQAMLAFAESLRQVLYPSTYSFFPFWYNKNGYFPSGNYNVFIYDTGEHKFIKTLKFIPGVFRCDTFVLYAYSLIGIKIPLVVTTPKNVFDSFIKSRKVRYQPKVFVKFRNTYLGYLVKNDGSNLESEIIDIFSKNDFNYYDADNICLQFLYSPIYTRVQKINFLWQLAKNYNGNTSKFSYLMGMLSYFKPLELSQQMISLYNMSSSQDIKIALIETMTYSCYYFDEKRALSLTNNQIQGLVQLIDFLESHAHKAKSKTLKRKALSGSLIVTTQKKSSRILKDIISKDTKLLSQYLLEFYQLNLALTSPYSNQTKMLLSTISTFEKNEDSRVLTCQALNIFPQNSISIGSRKLLSSYLMASNMMITNNTNRLKSNYCPWLTVYAKLHSNSTNDRILFEYNYLKSIKNISEFKKSLLGITLRDIRSFNTDKLKKLRDHYDILISKSTQAKHKSDHDFNFITYHY